mmetsp:Transcript_8687/g.28627  ORF Transcript_8687/g.28627 Transcript_8687/m.28627 type:complete len:313 (-) Transcript_8687:24-962(-)
MEIALAQSPSRINTGVRGGVDGLHPGSPTLGLVSAAAAAAAAATASAFAAATRRSKTESEFPLLATAGGASFEHAPSEPPASQAPALTSARAGRSCLRASSSESKNSFASAETVHHGRPERSGGISVPSGAATMGRVLARRANMTTPTEKMSASYDQSGPAATSGATYPGVPRKSTSAAAAVTVHAWPRSHRARRRGGQASSMASRFSSLMSRCTRPCDCRWATALHSCPTIGRTWPSVSAPCRRSSCWQSPPAPSSSTSPTAVLEVSQSTHCAMCGCSPSSCSSRFSRCRMQTTFDQQCGGRAARSASLSA